jgi:hypothetical protein
MKSRKKILSITLKALILLGSVVGLIFALQISRGSSRFSKDDSGKSLAANLLPMAAQVYTPLPAFTPMPDHTPTPIPIVLENGWYLYSDPDGEFSFAYPPTALIQVGQNPVDFSKNITIQFKLPEKQYQGMSVRLEPNPNRLQAADIAIQLFEKSAQKPVPAEFTNSLQQIFVGGISAVQATIPSTNTEVTVIISYNDKVFIVSPVHASAATKVEKETLEVFFQILNTFKFGISK